MKTKIEMRKNEKRKRENENEKLQKKRETKNKNKKRKQKTKMRNGNLPSSFNSFSILSSVPPDGNAGRESGRETVITNITYHTNIIVTDILSYEIVMYVYRGVKTEEKRASPNLFYYVI